MDMFVYAQVGLTVLNVNWIIDHVNQLLVGMMVSILSSFS
jgi:hypothetical protein